MSSDSTLPPRFSFREHCTEHVEGHEGVWHIGARPGEQHGVSHAEVARHLLQVRLVQRPFGTPALADEHEERVWHAGEHLRHGAQQHVVSLDASTYEVARRERVISQWRIEIGHVADDGPPGRNAEFAPHPCAIGARRVVQVGILPVVDQFDVRSGHVATRVQGARVLARRDDPGVEGCRPEVDGAKDRRLEVVGARDHGEPHRNVSRPGGDPAEHNRGEQVEVHDIGPQLPQQRDEVQKRLRGGEGVATGQDVEVQHVEGNAVACQSCLERATASADDGGGLMSPAAQVAQHLMHPVGSVCGRCNVHDVQPGVARVGAGVRTNGHGTTTAGV